MKDTGILFKGDMVRAIQERRKTQTRRVDDRNKVMRTVNRNPNSWAFLGINGSLGDPASDGSAWAGFNYRESTSPIYAKCPYGQVGDRLWVRETHWRYGRWIRNGRTKSGRQAWKFLATTDEVRYMDDAPRRLYEGRSLYTRKYIADYKLSDWVKRPSIFLPKSASRITLEITGVKVERVREITIADAKAEGVEGESFDGGQTFAYRGPFATLWDEINFKRGYGWDVNPWNWALTFKVVS